MTKPVFIIGFMGAGKTTLAKEISIKLGMSFLDSDTEIEKQEGKSIADIFTFQGEFYFRNLETNWLKNLLDEPKVISCGGGLPCFNDNILILKKKGRVVYLDSPNDIILERIFSDNSRPLISKKSKEEILEIKRNRELYYKLADSQILSMEELGKIIDLS
jgi:shikimate kinase